MIRRLLRHFSEQFGRMLVIPNPPAPPLPPVKVRVDMPPVKPCKVTSIEPWPDPPQVSCLVRGIVRSLETQPDEWYNRHDHLNDVALKHRGRNVAIEYVAPFTFDDAVSKRPLGVSAAFGRIDYTFTPHEARVVQDAIDTMKVARDERRKLEAAKLEEASRVWASAKLREFEDLGCPTPTS